MRKEAFLLWSPHACGEYGRPPKGVNCGVGSSPRLWGIRCLRSHVRELPRFIPTRVGNTPARRGGPGRCAVHPHACGEYASPHETCVRDAGSSPRVWGIPLSRADVPKVRRFIPTRVGNTSMMLLRPAKEPVHPHACGEYWSTRSRWARAIGSSPRVWGIRARAPCRWRPARFIPTRVGNTHRQYILCMMDAVHPHACGEYVSTYRSMLHEVGSSPRVWGIRLQG